MQRPRIGDVYEIATAARLAYAQYTHDTDGGRFGEVLRVLDGIHTRRPASFDGVPTRYVVLYPLRQLAARRILDLELVVNAAVPPAAREFPVFRNGTPGPDGKVVVWWLWDGREETRVGALAPEQRALPFFEVLNPEALREAIETGWTPATDPRT